jgi:hypothetical protein
LKKQKQKQKQKQNKKYFCLYKYKYKYKYKMMTWDDLKNLNLKPYREPEIENEYLLFKKNNKMSDHILNNVLQINKNDDENKKLYLTINKYPYHVENNVIHFIIWDLQLDGRDLKKNKLKYKKFANKLFNPKYFDIIIRINNVEHQSIREIKHCHLFIKLK